MSSEVVACEDLSINVLFTNLGLILMKLWWPHVRKKCRKALLMHKQYKLTKK